MGKVVDTNLRVKGVCGLRIVDASILPVVVPAHLVVTVYSRGTGHLEHPPGPEAVHKVHTALARAATVLSLPVEKISTNSPFLLVLLAILVQTNFRPMVHLFTYRKTDGLSSTAGGSSSFVLLSLGEERRLRRHCCCCQGLGPALPSPSSERL
ncbi:hypothetical protein PG994_005948 [Apiospora phragmitis]|uniref:Glucose-methanol-choline oxidoreductase C-terminal domain-containing protein n=1 Tax=Apiospora phragmitis TaxID=2905665 RepID=A0ABR1VDN1_9PEZI